ncbi:MAG: ABC transporter ATP-binding protein [Clostridiales bacterium]|nr:ABC transporter ATP-binding protein [Clostridiales bacterium]
MKTQIHKNRILEIGILLFLAISNILMVVNSFMNIRMTNAVIDRDFKTFLVYLSIVIIMMISVSIVQYFGSVLQAASKKHIARKLREKYFKNYVENYCLSQKNIADIGVSRLTNDVSYIIQHKIDAGYRFWNLAMGVVFPLGGAVLIHWSFLLVFPVSAVISIFAMSRLSPILQQISSEQSNENERFVAKISDLMGGFSTLFSFQALSGFFEKVKDASMTLEEKKEAYGKKFAFAQSMMMCTMVLSQLIYVIVAGLLVIGGKTTPGAIVGLMSIASAFYGNCQNLLSVKMEMDSAKPLCDKLLTVDLTAPKSSVSLKEMNEKIEVRQLTFQYPDTEKKIFDNASFVFETGKKYLIHGKSGSGKSTLMKLISGRLTDYQGTILYDDVEIKTCLHNA